MITRKQTRHTTVRLQRRNRTGRTAVTSLARRGQRSPTSAKGKSSIRPFRVKVPQAEVTELRRRIKATRFPERETVRDLSQGVPLATVQKLAKYWATEYDWRKCEARLNAAPNFITEIDGRKITGSDDVSSAVAARKPGEKAQVTVERGGNRRTLTVDLGTRPETPGGG